MPSGRGAEGACRHLHAAAAAGYRLPEPDGLPAPEPLVEPKPPIEPPAAALPVALRESEPVPIRLPLESRAVPELLEPLEPLRSDCAPELPESVGLLASLPGLLSRLPAPELLVPVAALPEVPADELPDCAKTGAAQSRTAAANGTE